MSVSTAITTPAPPAPTKPITMPMASMVRKTIIGKPAQYPDEDVYYMPTVRVLFLFDGAFAQLDEQDGGDESDDAQADIG